jgi:hypothetical protein
MPPNVNDNYLPVVVVVVVVLVLLPPLLLDASATPASRPIADTPITTLLPSAKLVAVSPAAAPVFCVVVVSAAFALRLSIPAINKVLIAVIFIFTPSLFVEGRSLVFHPTFNSSSFACFQTRYRP